MRAKCRTCGLACAQAAAAIGVGVAAAGVSIGPGAEEAGKAALELRGGAEPPLREDWASSRSWRS